MTQRTLTFDAPLTSADLPRLGKQLAAVRQIMSDSRWHTIDELRRALGGMGIKASTQSISARLRDLRKEPLLWTVERESLGGGVFQYRIAK